ncbi:MAG: hypothetical protein ACTHKG_09670 [Nocardioides sp.]
MSTLAVGGRLAAAPPARSVVAVLAVQEARRLLRHPLVVAGFVLYVVLVAVTMFADQGPRSAFETVAMLPTFYPGLFLVLAGTLVATRDRRAGSEEILGPLPGRAEERVLAVALAALAPAALALVGALANHLGYLALDRYADTGGAMPTVWHLLGGPVSLVGAVVLGLMLGVWFPSRVTGLVGLVAIVVANLWLDGRGDLALLGPALGWAQWGLYADDWAGVRDGSAALHVLYLVGLCGMAVAAAWVRVAHRRTPAVVLGVVATVVAVTAGIGQLP